MPDVRVKMDMHNTYVECTEASVTLPKYAAAIVDWRVRPLIDKLTLKRPSWVFIAAGYGTSLTDGTTSYSKFKVEENGAHLGWIDVESNWRDNTDYTYTFDCARLSMKRSRGAYTKTKHVDKAVKTITANMFGLTMKERMVQETSAARGQLHKVVNDASFRYHSIVRKLTEPLTTFATSRWDEFVTYVDDTNDHPTAELLPAARERNRLMQGVTDVSSAKQGAVILEFGGRYYVQFDATPEDTHDFTLDTLPLTLKSHLSLLKLVDKDMAIEGVGMRTSDAVFYVYI